MNKLTKSVSAVKPIPVKKVQKKEDFNEVECSLEWGDRTFKFNLQGMSPSSNDVELTDADMCLTIRKGKHSKTLRFYLNGISGCCGMSELNGFGISSNVSKSGDKITDKETVEAIKKTFEVIINSSKTTEYTKKDSEICYFFTTVDSYIGKLIDKALEKNEPFTLVKTFKNVNSGNVNKLYVSN